VDKTRLSKLGRTRNGRPRFRALKHLEMKLQFSRRNVTGNAVLIAMRAEKSGSVIFETEGYTLI